jgi:hypothetical protein
MYWLGEKKHFGLNTKIKTKQIVICTSCRAIAIGQSLLSLREDVNMLSLIMIIKKQQKNKKRKL